MNNTQKRILFIINPISGGRKKDDLPDLIANYIDPDFDIQFLHTEYRGHSAEITGSSHGSFDAIVAIGGDGTVNEIANQLSGTSCALGIIPTGSGNGVARHLKIPLNIKSAVERINAFQPQTVDSGKVNDQFFLGTCGFGFDAYIAQQFHKNGKRGFINYAKLVAGGLGRYDPLIYHIKLADSTIDQKAFICAIANSSQFGNGFTISPDSDMTDGQIELILIEKFPLADTPFIGTRFFTQKIQNSKYFNSYKVETSVEIHVQQDGPVHYHLDGEPFEGKGPFRIDIYPGSIRIV